MLDKVDVGAAASRVKAGFDVAVASVATAVPANAVAQTRAAERAREVFPQFTHMESLYTNTGIGTRYCCEPEAWYHQPHSWEERTASFQRHALDLLERVARDATTAAGLRFDQIDAVVTNTTTGLAVPSLDAMLMNRLDFAPHTERLPIFGLGCAGGVAGLARATRVAQTLPGGNVLFLSVELCSLCFRVNDPSATMFVAAGLFGDGAAAVVLRNTADGSSSLDGRKIVAVGEHFWRDTEYIMGWDIKNDGFGVVMSIDLPNMIRENLPAAVMAFLDRAGTTFSDLDGILCHAGSKRILDVVEDVLALMPADLEPSRAVLRDFGNMSSVTALFVLKHAIESGRHGRHLMVAVGPGFSANFVILDL